MRWWILGLITYDKAFKFLSSFLNKKVKSCKSSHRQHFTVSQLTNLSMHMCGLTFWPAFKEYQEPSQKAELGHRNSTETFTLNVLPSAKPAGEKLQHKLLPKFPALPAHAWLGHQTQRTCTACSVALQKDNFFLFPSQDALHFPASGRIRNVGRFRAGVCILFDSLKPKLIH